MKLRSIFVPGMFLAAGIAAATDNAPNRASDPIRVNTQVASTDAGSSEDIGAALVANLVEVCARHPEVERAFVLVKAAPHGTATYMFVPIFDRKVSDLVLSEAQSVYANLNPSGGYLPVMLLARNQWKKQLAGAPPIYLRPKRTQAP